jgi:hypothetical protein
MLPVVALISDNPKLLKTDSKIGTKTKRDEKE